MNPALVEVGKNINTVTDVKNQRLKSASWVFNKTRNDYYGNP